MNAGDEVWVTSIVERARFVTDSPLVASFLTLGWIPIVTTGIVFLTADSPSQSFVIFQTLTALIIVTGPYQAYRYDTHVLPGFFEDVFELVAESDHDSLREIQSRYQRLFRNHNLPFVLGWTLLVVSVLPLNRAYFASQGIVPGSGTSIAYLVFLVNFGLLSGLGLYSVLVTIRSIAAVSELTLEIDPLHPDGFGGLRVIGNFAVWTTVLVSNGALAIPLSIDMVTTTPGAVVVYTGIGAYILFIVLSFLYPVLKVNRRAQKYREEHLQRYRSRIRELETESAELLAGGDQNEMKRLALNLELDRAREQFQAYRNMKLYPLSIKIIIRLISSVLLPIVFIIFELTVSMML